MFARLSSLLALLLTACAFVLLLAIPASAGAAVDLEARLGADGVERVQERFVTDVGATIIVYVTVVNAGTDPSPAGALLGMSLPAGLRSTAPASMPADVTCAAGSGSGMSCTLPAIEPAQSRQIVLTTQAWRVGRQTLAATVAAAGDLTGANDAASFPIDVGAMRTGRRCSILGTSGPDVLVGTAGADTICGLGGADRIAAGADRDTVHGDAGNDAITLGAGGDLAFGGAGNDRIRGGVGIDSLQGGAGNDDLRGDGDPGVLRGDSGNDLLVGGTELDAFFGGSGNDVIRACDSMSEVVIGQGGVDRAILDPSDMPFTLERIELCR